MTATIRHYADFELHGSMIHGQELNDFPQNPRRNQECLVNGVLWIYSEVEGILTWFPLNNKKTTYVHTQAVPSTDWNIQHNRGTQVFVFGIYDADGKLTSANGPGDVTDNNFHLYFTEAVSGRVVVFFETEAFLPAVNSEAVNTETLNVGDGAVVADANGLTVNGNAVLTVDNNGVADFGTLD